ncbi:MAG: TauD/TfdA family dioxygenase, partial [Pseudomonadota bacterium]
FREIHEAFLAYGFLLFPGQFLSDAENIAFGERFGELEFGANPMSNQHRHRDGSYGKVFDIDTQRMRTNVGNEAWHTDSTYKPLSSKCAMLSAVTVPKTGGETALADQRAAYEALDQATRERIANLSAYHSTEFSQANDLGDFPPREQDSIYHGEAYLRPMVKMHPETGRPSLFVGRHAFGIPGLARSESRALLKQLIDFVVSDESRVYTHQWNEGDTLLWDNRYVLHRAMPYDYSEPRVLIGTRIAGDPETELAYYPSDPAAQAGREALDAELSILRNETVDRRYGATTAEQVT